MIFAASCRFRRPLKYDVMYGLDATSTSPLFTYSFAWLKMLYASPRIWSVTRSVARKFLYTPRSRFHVPGSRKKFRPIMFDGNGPHSDVPIFGLNQPVTAY